MNLSFVHLLTGRCGSWENVHVNVDVVFSALLVKLTKAVTEEWQRQKGNCDQKHQIFRSQDYGWGHFFSSFKRRYQIRTNTWNNRSAFPWSISVHQHTSTLCSPHPSQYELRCKLTGIPFMCQNNRRKNGRRDPSFKSVNSQPTGRQTSCSCTT